MNRIAIAGVVVGVGVAVAALPAQSDWQLCGSDAAVRVRGAATTVLQGPRATATALAAGDYAVHFEVDAAGKPASLAFTVPEQARVQLAVERAAAATPRELALDAGEWTQTDGAETVRTTGSRDDGDYRVAATWPAGAAAATFGVVARWRSEQEYYAFVFDRARAEARLERHLGPDAFVLARAPVAAAANSHTLALQVQGFRIQASIDDDVVLQQLDGAIAKGAFGVCWRGERPTCSRFTVAPPAPPRASAAAVCEAARVVLHVATNATPGCYYAVELGLDRPHPLVPLDLTGIEPWVMTRPAAPRVLLTDLRRGLGKDSYGEVPASGTVVAALEWPALPALRGQSVLARLWVVTADGDQVVARTPAVSIRL